jgi:predicted transposase YdaD
MPMPFDATMKGLVERFQGDYETMLDLGEGPLSPLNVDLSTITAATDVALGHGEPLDRIVDINFQSGPDELLDARVLLYNVLLHYRFRVPVHSVLVLLRPIADGPHCGGKLCYEGRPQKGKIEFTYEVIRLWEQPVQRFLEGGLGTLPLATLCRLPEAVEEEQALESVVRTIAARLAREARPEDRATLLTAAYVLIGLRVPRPVADRLFQGVQTMRESTTYQAIVEEGVVRGRAEGRAEGLRRVLFRLGSRRFGPVPEAVRQGIESISDSDRLEELTERALAVTSWNELLQDNGS